MVRVREINGRVVCVFMGLLLLSFGVYSRLTNEWLEIYTGPIRREGKGSFLFINSR